MTSSEVKRKKLDKIPIDPVDGFHLLTYLLTFDKHATTLSNPQKKVWLQKDSEEKLSFCVRSCLTSNVWQINFSQSISKVKGWQTSNILINSRRKCLSCRPCRHVHNHRRVADRLDHHPVHYYHSHRATNNSSDHDTEAGAQSVHDCRMRESG